jgi:hypothetical protein
MGLISAEIEEIASLALAMTIVTPSLRVMKNEQPASLMARRSNLM